MSELYIRYKVRIAALEQENAKLKEQLEIAVSTLDEIGHFGYNSNPKGINYEKACTYLANKAYSSLEKITNKESGDE